MVTLMTVRMAFRAICHHAMRSLLTLLGIVIGIAGIIAIVSVGTGAQKRARDQWLVYGAKNISIYVGNFMSQSKKPPKPLTLDDVDIIKMQCPAVEYVSPLAYRSNIPVEYEGNTSSANIIGMNEYELYITDQSMRTGINFSHDHSTHKENVVILGPEIVDVLFKLQDPRGKIIRINKKPFMVIGVLNPPKVKPKWDFGLLRVFIPFTTHQKIFGDILRQIQLSTYTEQQVPEVIRQLEKIFRTAHQIKADEPNDFIIEDAQTFAKTAEQAAKSVGLFSIIAAIIALIVGGIGVMNIMLVAVHERTKEIGIKMALGATTNVIRMQFLLEAVAICMIGGLIGVMCGVAASVVLDRIFKIPAIVELMPMLIAFFFTALIGLVFGFYPAERAARLRPVDALTEQ